MRLRLYQCIYLLTMIVWLLVRGTSFPLFNAVLGTSVGQMTRASRLIRAGLLLLAPLGRGVSVAPRGRTLGGIAMAPIEPALVANYLRGKAGEGSLLVRHKILFSTVALYVKVGLEGSDARLREKVEPFGDGGLPVILTMIVRTVRLLAVGAVLTLLCLEEIRVVLLFLPPVTVHALVLIGTALLIRADEVVDLPVGAHLALVSESGGAPTEVLPVMRVHTDFPVVVVLPVRTPNCLEQEHVIVHIDFVLLDELNR